MFAMSIFLIINITIALVLIIAGDGKLVYFGLAGFFIFEGILILCLERKPRKPKDNS